MRVRFDPARRYLYYTRGWFVPPEGGEGSMSCSWCIDSWDGTLLRAHRFDPLTERWEPIPEGSHAWQRLIASLRLCELHQRTSTHYRRLHAGYLALLTPEVVARPLPRAPLSVSAIPVPL